ncbi:predicted protein [Plenodomus lingam JN3]|uniref:Predicted protein n=1 Tax=Leptosphaeria maculans (strain JN3 / isolate v23.1.3 / race Av1-4-5-6-7-8) TaxID=985895 RepID=E5AA99_LEPMJ|nr:predicted protein [Plenodomus lingam JN3]CBY00590.1 predicted protein [Plenodomus lingam JN3]
MPALANLRQNTQELLDTCLQISCGNIAAGHGLRGVVTVLLLCSFWSAGLANAIRPGHKPAKPMLEQRAAPIPIGTTIRPHRAGDSLGPKPSIPRRPFVGTESTWTKVYPGTTITPFAVNQCRVSNHLG